MNELKLEAKTEHLEQVLAHVDAILESADCPPRAQMQIDIAVEEIFVNIAHYAYSPHTGEAVIGVELLENPPAVRITFRDHGIPYDPLAKPDPDVTLAAEDRQIGGLGIFMVKKSMDDMAYVYQDGQNILTITKKL